MPTLQLVEVVLGNHSYVCICDMVEAGKEFRVEYTSILYAYKVLKHPLLWSTLIWYSPPAFSHTTGSGEWARDVTNREGAPGEHPPSIHTYHGNSRSAGEAVFIFFKMTQNDQRGTPT